METELVEGILQFDPELRYTRNGKSLCKVQISNDEEQLNIVAWDENADMLSELKKYNKIIIKGYRKYNDFGKIEEFIIIQFIKRFKGE